jgi:hypothetical protein
MFANMRTVSAAAAEALGATEFPYVIEVRCLPDFPPAAESTALLALEEFEW